MHSNKPQTYDKKVRIPNIDKKVEVNNVDHKHKANPKPKRKFTPLNDTVDNIINVLLKENLIELPPIVELKFPNGVLKNF